MDSKHISACANRVSAASYFESSFCQQVTIPSGDRHIVRAPLFFLLLGPRISALFIVGCVSVDRCRNKISNKKRGI